ncbi:MAG: imidazole glycerol phosphate synthase subunit HisH [Clostridia bacterium]|nr:imidazole glycerol phosphate synthase subunit HisH [Clostridia bacterium]
MISIVDYGVGNLFSLSSSLRSIGADTIVTNDKQKILDSSAIILPGVGAFSDAQEKLRNSGLFELIKSEAEKGKKLLGICLGMQMLFEKSFEYGEYEGLGLIKGNIMPLEGKIPSELKIPHIGWNSLNFKNGKSDLFKYINEGDFVYFVHSYYGADCEESVIATSEYGIDVTAAVQKDNIYGCQFHPEKSGDVGLNILKSFCEMGDC